MATLWVPGHQRNRRRSGPSLADTVDGIRGTRSGLAWKPGAPGSAKSGTGRGVRGNRARADGGVRLWGTTEQLTADFCDPEPRAGRAGRPAADAANRAAAAAPRPARSWSKRSPPSSWTLLRGSRRVHQEQGREGPGARRATRAVRADERRGAGAANGGSPAPGRCWCSSTVPRRRPTAASAGCVGRGRRQPPPAESRTPALVSTTSSMPTTGACWLSSTAASRRTQSSTPWRWRGARGSSLGRRGAAPRVAFARRPDRRAALRGMRGGGAVDDTDDPPVRRRSGRPEREGGRARGSRVAAGLCGH